MERITPKSGRTLRGTAMALSETGKPILRGVNAVNTVCTRPGRMESRMWMYKEIYKMLEELIEGFQFMPDYLKLKAPGFMDYLNIDKLGVGIIALSRYYENSSGHRIADPDMEIKLDHQN